MPLTFLSLQPNFVTIARDRRGRHRDIDWRAVEQDYRSAGLSLRALAQKHGCSHSAIANCASRNGWRREPLPATDTEAPRAQAGQDPSRGRPHGPA